MNFPYILGFILGFGRRGKGPKHSQAQWWTGSAGARGPQSIAFAVRRLGVRLPHAAGLFIICARQEDGGWKPLLAGETQDLATRVRSHELMPEFLLLGASHVHFALTRAERAERIVLAGQIVHAYDPQLNRPGAKGFMQTIEGQGPGPEVRQDFEAAGTFQSA